MPNRNPRGKGGQNNIDRIYSLNRWLSFQQEQMEKRYRLEIQQRQRYSFIGMVLFNVLNIVYAFLSTNSLTFIIFPILKWLMIICLLFSVGIIYLHKQCIEKNNLFQLLIRLSSLYFYCSHYLNADQLELGKTATLFISSSLAVSIHMVLTNLLTLTHWKQHVFTNLVSFSVVQLIVFLSSRDALIQLNIIYFLFVQAGLHIFAGFNELFIREFWIHLDVSKKQSAQLQNVIDELPQPLLVIDTQNDIQLSNFSALKFFQSILPEKEENLQRNIAQNPSKILQRLNPEDLQIIENLTKQVKESQQICSVTFQKEIKKQDASEKVENKLVNLTLIGSHISWKTQICTLIQIQEAEKLIEKEIEQKTITIERVYEVQNKQNQVETINEIKHEKNQAYSKKGMTEQEITSIQLVQYPPTKPFRTLTQVDNVISIHIPGNNNLLRDVSPDISVFKNKTKQKKIISPNQSPINFISPIEKSSDDMSHLISTQDNSEGEVNINVDEEIYKHFSFIESGLSNLLTKIISQIQGIKGKKINLSFGSVENSPNIRISGSHHNISGNKLTVPTNINGSFYPSRQDNNKELISPMKPGVKGDTKINKKALLLQEDLKKCDNNISQQKEANNIHNIINEKKYQVVLNDYSDDETNDVIDNNIPIVIQKSNNSQLNISHSGANTPLTQSTHKITEIKEEPEEEIASIVPSKRKQFKYNEICTILLFEESSNTRMTIPYIKFDQPTKPTIIPFSEGEKALSLYFENINQGVLFHFMILGIEAHKGINGIDIVTKIRAYERENLIPRTHLVALFNSVDSEVGGKTKSTDTYLFKGFDQAFEKPINKTIVNDIINDRLNPQIIYSSEEDYTQRYRYQEKFTVLICDDQIQTAMIFKEYAQSLSVEAEIAKSEKSLLNHYYSQIDSGRLYQIIMIAINSTQMSGIEIVKKIREYENEKKPKRTFIVGMFKSLNETIGSNQRSSSPQKYKEEGFDEIVEKPLEKEVVSDLIERVKRNIELEELMGRSGQKNSSQNQIKSFSQLQVEKSNSKSSSLLKISPQQYSKNKEMNMDDYEQQAANNLFKKTKESGIKFCGNSSITEFGQQSSGSKNQFKKEDFGEQNKLNESTLSNSSKQSFSINILKTPPPHNRKQQNSSRSQLDDEELQANIFNKVKSQGIKIGEEKTQKLDQPSSQQKSQNSKSQIDLDELELNSNIFNKVKSSGIKFGGGIENKQVQSTQESKPDDKQTQGDRDDELAFRIFNKQNKSVTNSNEEKFQNVQKMQQLSNNRRTSEEDDDIEMRQASSLFCSINKQGIKIGGEDNKQSETTSKQSTVQVTQQKSPVIVQQQKTQNNTLQIEPGVIRSKNLSISQRNINDMTENILKLDQLKRNTSKQSSSEDQSKVLTQPSPQQNQQSNQPSPNTNKKPGQKPESQKQSPLMTISQISRSPIQNFNGKTSPNQTNMQFVQNKQAVQFKYNEKPTFLVMEDSSLVMMNISFMKYDIPKVLETSTNGEAALEKYMNNINNNTLYHFIILGVNNEKGMNGNEVMNKIRQHEKNNNLPRTYLIASYNSITSEIGGSSFNKETFLFRGFDDALEKPIKALDMNSVLKQRANPQLVYAKKEDISTKYRFFDKFSILVSDEADQITLTVSSLQLDNIEKPVFTWNGQSLYNKYISSIQAGRLYSFILTGIRALDLKQEDVIKKIRQYEKDNNVPQTYIIGFMRMQQKNSPTVEELLQEGYSDIIDSGISSEDLIKIITKLKLTLKLKL